MAIPENSAKPNHDESPSSNEMTAIEDLGHGTVSMLVEVFNETAAEALERSQSRLNAMREGVVAASMALVAVTNINDKYARELVRKWAHNNPDLEF